MNIKSIYYHFLECNSICIDTRKLIKNDFFFALKGDNFNGNCFAKEAIKSGAKYALIDEKEYEDKNIFLVKDVLKTLQELATYHRQKLNVPIITLTGSNGKTTTKELINAVLSKKNVTSATVGNLNNHIGVPLTLLAMTNKTEIGIVEMGANHLKEIEFLCKIALPDFGLITNFGKAHLEGFGSVEGVIKGKSELFDYLKANNKIVFINTDDKKQVEQIGTYPNVITFGSKTDNNCIVNYIEADPFVVLKYKKEVIKSKLIGDYNSGNISAAIAIGDYFKIPEIDIKSAIENYSPKNNRSEIIKKGSNEIIMDAYNANPSSMAAAISSFNKLERPNKIAFLGDMFELGETSTKEHQKIVDLIEKMKLNEVYLVGANFYKTRSTFKNIRILRSFEDLEQHLLNNKIKNSSILIKGSRGMAMERILGLLG